MTLTMTNEDWKLIRFFKKTENWGDPEKMSKVLVFALDAFRAYLDRTVVINNAFALTGHTDGSYHGTGEAADIHVPGMSVVDQFIAASRFDAFNGIGIYPYWNNAGLHLDVRPHYKKWEPDARWCRNAAGVYVQLDWKFLKSLA